MPAKIKSAQKTGPKKTLRKDTPAITPTVDLFERVVGILEQARVGVVRAVNSHMVLAYWMIGREIVQELQGGKGRAAYGEQVIADLSRKLTMRYGAGFSETNLKHFRTFYSVYGIRHPLGDESDATPRATPVGHPAGAVLNGLEQSSAIPRQLGVEFVATPLAVTKLAIRHPAGDKCLSGGGVLAIQHPVGTEVQRLSGKCYPAGSESLSGFSPQLSCFLYLPTEKELSREIERERRLIEAQAGTFAEAAKRGGDSSA
jgi:hypothetical protein